MPLRYTACLSVSNRNLPDDFKKYFDADELKNNGKVKLNTTTAAQEIIGSDISAVVVLKATSKWGDVAGNGTEFTVTFKKGAQ